MFSQPIDNKYMLLIRRLQENHAREVNLNFSISFIHYC